MTTILDLSQAVTDLFRQAAVFAFDQTVDAEFRLGWETCLLFMARQTGIDTSMFPHAHLKMLKKRVNQRVMREATRLSAKREDAWRYYTSLMSEIGPDDQRTRQAKADHVRADMRCVRFAGRYPVEWTLALTSP